MKPSRRKVVSVFEIHQEVVAACEFARFAQIFPELSGQISKSCRCQKLPIRNVIWQNNVHQLPFFWVSEAPLADAVRLCVPWPPERISHPMRFPSVDCRCSNVRYREDLSFIRFRVPIEKNPEKDWFEPGSFLLQSLCGFAENKGRVASGAWLTIIADMSGNGTRRHTGAWKAPSLCNPSRSAFVESKKLASRTSKGSDIREKWNS